MFVGTGPGKIETVGEEFAMSGGDEGGWSGGGFGSNSVEGGSNGVD